MYETRNTSTGTRAVVSNVMKRPMTAPSVEATLEDS